MHSGSCSQTTTSYKCVIDKERWEGNLFPRDHEVRKLPDFFELTLHVVELTLHVVVIFVEPVDFQTAFAKKIALYNSTDISGKPHRFQLLFVNCVTFIESQKFTISAS